MEFFRPTQRNKEHFRSNQMTSSCGFTQSNHGQTNNHPWLLSCVKTAFMRLDSTGEIQRDSDFNSSVYPPDDMGAICYWSDQYITETPYNINSEVSAQSGWLKNLAGCQGFVPPFGQGYHSYYDYHPLVQPSRADNCKNTMMRGVMKGEGASAEPTLKKKVSKPLNPNAAPWFPPNFCSELVESFFNSSSQKSSNPDLDLVGKNLDDSGTNLDLICDTVPSKMCDLELSGNSHFSALQMEKSDHQVVDSPCSDAPACSSIREDATESFEDSQDCSLQSWSQDVSEISGIAPVDSSVCQSDVSGAPALKVEAADGESSGNEDLSVAFEDSGSFCIEFASPTGASILSSENEGNACHKSVESELMPQRVHVKISSPKSDKPLSSHIDVLLERRPYKKKKKNKPSSKKRKQMKLLKDSSPPNESDSSSMETPKASGKVTVSPPLQIPGSPNISQISFIVTPRGSPAQSSLSGVSFGSPSSDSEKFSMNFLIQSSELSSDSEDSSWDEESPDGDDGDWGGLPVCGLTTLNGNLGFEFECQISQKEDEGGDADGNLSCEVTVLKSKALLEADKKWCQAYGEDVNCQEHEPSKVRVG